MMWLEEMDTNVIPALSDASSGAHVTELKKITAQIKLDNQDAFLGCRNVLMQQKLVAGTYVGNTTQAFALHEYISKLELRHRFEVLPKPLP